MTPRMSIPEFSIVTPTFNRASELRRSVESVLRQSMSNFELIVVDDGSTDETRAVLMTVGDPRLRVIRHPENRGVTPARASGVAAATGEWLVFLDSDDELYPGALAQMSAHSKGSAPGIGRFCFSYRGEDGAISPWPVLDEEVQDYDRYLEWMNVTVRSDFCNCIRRETFEVVPFPPGRVYEQLYHLNFAQRFRSFMSPVVVGVIHCDAANRITNLTMRDRIRKALREAPAEVAGIEEVLRSHGAALRRRAPRAYCALLRKRSYLHFLAGERVRGISCGIQGVRECPLSVETWLTLGLGVASRRALGAAIAMKGRLSA